MQKNIQAAWLFTILLFVLSPAQVGAGGMSTKNKNARKLLFYKKQKRKIPVENLIAGAGLTFLLIILFGYLGVKKCVKREEALSEQRREEELRERYLRISRDSEARRAAQQQQEHEEFVDRVNQLQVATETSWDTIIAEADEKKAKDKLFFSEERNAIHNETGPNPLLAKVTKAYIEEFDSANPSEESQTRTQALRKIIFLLIGTSKPCLIDGAPYLWVVSAHGIDISQIISKFFHADDPAPYVASFLQQKNASQEDFLDLIFQEEDQARLSGVIDFIYKGEEYYFDPSYRLTSEIPAYLAFIQKLLDLAATKAESDDFLKSAYNQKIKRYAFSFLREEYPAEEMTYLLSHYAALTQNTKTNPVNPINIFTEKNEQGKTLLLRAIEEIDSAQGGDREMRNFILSLLTEDEIFNAIANEADGEGHTPLIMTLRGEGKERKIAEKLIEKGVDLEGVQIDDTPLLTFLLKNEHFFIAGKLFTERKDDFDRDIQPVDINVIKNIHPKKCRTILESSKKIE